MAVFLPLTKFPKPKWCVLLVLFCCAHNAQGRQGSSNKKYFATENLHIHFLCDRRLYVRQLFSSDNGRHFHILSWCGDWNRYIEVLAKACLLHDHILIVVSTIAWQIILPMSENLRKGTCSHVKWLRVNETNGTTSREKIAPNNATRLQTVIDALRQQVTPSDIAALSKQRPHSRAITWSLLAGQKVSIGCIVLNRTHIGEACLSYDENTLAQALDQINGTYDVVGIKRGTFARVLRRKQVDIVVNSVGITRDRHRLFAFTANKFGQAVFYVKKTWKHDIDLFSFGGLPLMLLSASSMLLSVGCIVFLNVRRGRRPMNGLGDVVLALTATTLAFSSPLPSDQARSALIRLVMASWMLACLTLVSYTRSLLTASLMAGPKWEADDSLDEILPKLQKGRLLPCAETNSFFDFALTKAAGNGSGVVDAMALATRRWARSRRDFTGTFQSCVERTRRGTHVFFTDSIDPCRFLRFEKVIVKGKKPVYSLIGGFPVRREFPLRSELISVVHRIFETGWEIRLERLAERNCSGLVEDEEMPLRGTAFMLIYCLCCIFSFIVFFLEFLFSHLFTSSRGRWPINFRYLNVKPGHSSWVRGSHNSHYRMR